MMRLLARWLVSVVALVVAAWVVPGITVSGKAWLAYAVMAVVLGLVNAIVRPLLKLLSCPLIILTLGLFLLVVNGVTLWLAAVVTEKLGFGFQVAGFWPAFFGALIVSVVSVLLSIVVPDRKKR
jgi:putative membrane protein